MNKSELPKFSTINTDGITSQLQLLLDQNRRELNKLITIKQPTWDNLLQPLEELEDRVHHFWSPISHLNGVANSPEIRKAYNAGLPLLTDYHTELGHNKALYQALQGVSEGPEYESLNQAQRMVLKNTLRDFKLAGVTLPDQEKKRFAQINKELSQLTTRFDENVLDATQGWTKHISDLTELKGLPEMAIESARQAAAQKQLDGWLLTLEAPSYLAVMMQADSRSLRQEVYTAFVTRASDQGPQAGRWDNSQVINDIMSLRLEKARLLGFNNFAELSLVPKMLSETQSVLDFLQHLLGASKAKAHLELQTLSEFAKEKAGISELKPWDIPYFSEKLRQQNYTVSQDELRQFFPLDKVLKGFFVIIEKLFSVNFKPVTDVDVWHPDVTCYAMYDDRQQLRSYIYLDIFARTNKRGGAWMDEYCGRRHLKTGGFQLPIAFLTCNFQAPVAGKPSLLTHEEVETLFHEFGHCLQHMLTRVDYLSVSGINGIPWDAVEVPSQFLENWTWERESLSYISEHYQTGQPFPEDLLERMRSAKNFQQALQMLRQLEFALFDFKLHIEFDAHHAQQVQQILNEVRSQTALVPVSPFNRFQNSFSHIFSGGYAAGYYSYKWAEVMACDAFSLFKERGIFDPDTSKKFLETFMESGGAVEPMELFIQFRGRAPQIEALLEQSGIIKGL